ncbi:uncharacterized protein Z519_03071 [Cladophialophora bantiana CBS 173.52]|uniref:Uncharacterized protein n=1 Tax=Cladophialophora bantiana (strain ATCC 10958 / CBS 173.52 / CDC B-1940 / NIH 8579) TaxID=1442370 RepID=A0A0D2HYN4_CLAB1|nr:uncharacterized protein Z519_03071 [Cladophialophora bantiana CBS 173.52]KIW96005.1 hypothetical protein Z519_03071 [Cladophialophora bantiana CBS 173.52]
MSSIRNSDGSGLSNDHRKLASSKEVPNAASPQSSSTPSTRVSAASGPSPKTGAEGSTVSASSPQGTQEHDQPLRMPPTHEDPSDKPANLQGNMSEPWTSVKMGQRMDECSGSGSHISDAPLQVREHSPCLQHIGSLSPGSSILLYVGSGLHSNTPQPYTQLVYLDDEDNRPSHHGEQQ